MEWSASADVVIEPGIGSLDCRWRSVLLDCWLADPERLLGSWSWAARPRV